MNLLTMVAVIIVNLGVGMLLFLFPVSTIDTQKKFYEKINWRMEPISVHKEIRNMKIMGLILFVVALLTIVYVIMLYR